MLGGLTRTYLMLPEPVSRSNGYLLFGGDALEILAELPDASVHAVVTDPPYGLEFMGKEWDSFGKEPRTDKRGVIDPAEWGGAQDPGGGTAYSRSRVRTGAAHYGGDAAAVGRAFGEWCEQWAAQCLRILKPGGHLLAFGGSRTYHRLACAVEDAGFEIRDSITWLYGSGFPKSMDVAKALDKAAGRERTMRVNERWAERYPNGPGGNLSGDDRSEHYSQAKRIVGNPLMTSDPVSEEAQRWAGWGTALKPSHEPLVVGRKPAGQNAILVDIGSHLGRLESACTSPVKPAERSSTPTPPTESEEKVGSAPEPVVTPPEDEPGNATATGGAVGSSAATGTSASESLDVMFSSTVTLWRDYWAEISTRMSTSTTAIASRMTTDLEILNSYLLQITPESITRDPSITSGKSSLVGVVDSLFVASVLHSRVTHALSAAESATDSTPTSPQGEVASADIVVGRKPLEGTVAQNVGKHGTGALNIDATRVGWGAGGDKSAERKAAGYSEAARKAMGGVVAQDNPTGYTGAVTGTDASKGRWPANVVLSHTDACQQVGTRQVRTGVAVQRNLPDEGSQSGDVAFKPSTKRNPDATYADADGTETIPAWVCAQGCPVAELDEQSGKIKSAGMYQKGARGLGAKEGPASIPIDGLTSASYADSGGASRFFPTFEADGSEPIVVARKPLDGTVVHNVAEHGTGALNIDASRVPADAKLRAWSDRYGNTDGYADGNEFLAGGLSSRTGSTPPAGRWPANVVLSHTPECEQIGTRQVKNRAGSINDAGPRDNAVYGKDERPRGDWTAYGDADGNEEVPAFECAPGCPIAELDEQSGKVKSTGTPDRPAQPTTYSNSGGYGGQLGLNAQGPLYSDEGGASRFFPTFRYQAKAPKKERPKVDGVSHATVKPLALMRWLVRLVTPPGGVVLEPFAGSGTTIEACRLEGFKCIAVEAESDYHPLIAARMEPHNKTWAKPVPPDEQVTEVT